MRLYKGSESQAVILCIAVFILTHTQGSSAGTDGRHHDKLSVKPWVKCYLGQIRLSQYVHLVSMFLKVVLSSHSFFVVLESVN